MRALLLSVLLCLIVSADASAQSNRWQAFPALNNVQAVAASSDAFWAGTDGGVFSYAPASGEIERYTSVEGLSGVDVRALAYDPAREVVWIGYADGVLDRLDVASGAVEAFQEIARADRFNARGINRIEAAGDSLRIATDFGLVIFDAVQAEVRDTYERFGTLPLGTATHDMLDAPLPDGRAGLWVGTREGIAHAPLDAPNLREPSAWTVEAESPHNVLSLAHFDGDVFSGAERVTEGGETVDGGARRRNADGTWTMLPYGGASVPEMLPVEDHLYVLSTFWVTVRDDDGESARYSLEIDSPYSVFQAAVLDPEESLWVGDGFDGLIAFPDLEDRPAGDVEPRQVVVPDGPGSNAVQAVAVGPEATIWMGFQPSEERSVVFARFDGTDWTSYSMSNGDLDARAGIRTIASEPSGNVWLGSEGAGLYHVAPDGEIVRYTTDNSTLSPADSPTYVVAPGVAVDEEGLVWVTNTFTSPPLHVRTPEDEWHALERPNTVPSAVLYRGLFIDSFGQKWIAGHRSDGLVVVDTGADPLDEADDRAVYVGSTGPAGTGLPDAEVRAIAEDRSGRLWIGTERGLATVFSPGSIFSGNAASQITWARTPDGASFFLRDLRILDIAVDPADRKWLASNSGVWLLNADGNEVIENFTAENSPLPSDAVVAVDIDEDDGTVYFATDAGLYSYRGDAIAPAAVPEDLFVYPNPVRADGGALPEIAITGLVDDADVRVLTVDGQLVAAFDTRGGSVRWDGRDQRTGEFVPSGVYIVAADGEGGTAYGKVAVIR